MTEAQKETLRFYATNDYLLINGILWGEDEKTIREFIQIINDDGRGVMAEAVEQGFDVRWDCSKEEGERIYQVYQKRFPIIDDQKVVDRILEQARNDIVNMMSCMEPLTSEMHLYRNIKTRFIDCLEAGMTLNYLGFSSCSISPHVVEDASYGSSGCTLAEIFVPADIPAIRLDLLPEVRNESDEIILAPVEYFVTRVERENNKIYLDCRKPLKVDFRAV
ncbi:MAG: hypothetical protein J5928_00795 [Firmicutes bacterium]|nr:hypothetical protein [Bacillota bacterium]